MNITLFVKDMTPLYYKTLSLKEFKRFKMLLK